MKNTYNLILASILIMAWGQFVLAADSSEKTKIQTTSALKKSVSQKPIEKLTQIKETLEKVKSMALLKSGSFPSVYIEAKTRIVEAENMISLTPKNPQIPNVLAVCSLLATAGSLQFKIIESKNEIEKIHQEKEEVFKKLNETYRNINSLERNYASNLKQDLNKNRIELLKQQEEARRLHEEAKAKFKNLESDVLKVKSDARGTILSMSDILFDVGKSNLKADLKTNLAKIAGILTVYRSSKLIVEGHTDNQGSKKLNQKLSENRSLNVLDFLVTQGIDSKRISSVGYGFSKPLADNSTKAGRQQNRRVDIVVVEKKEKKN